VDCAPAAHLAPVPYRAPAPLTLRMDSPFAEIASAKGQWVREVRVTRGSDTGSDRRLGRCTPMVCTGDALH